MGREERKKGERVGREGGLLLRGGRVREREGGEGREREGSPNIFPKFTPMWTEHIDWWSNRLHLY